KGNFQKSSIFVLLVLEFLKKRSKKLSIRQNKEEGDSYQSYLLSLSSFFWPYSLKSKLVGCAGSCSAKSMFVVGSLSVTTSKRKPSAQTFPFPISKTPKWMEALSSGTSKTSE